MIGELQNNNTTPVCAWETGTRKTSTRCLCSQETGTCETTTNVVFTENVELPQMQDFGIFRDFLEIISGN